VAAKKRNYFGNDSCGRLAGTSNTFIILLAERARMTGKWKVLGS